MARRRLQRTAQGGDREFAKGHPAQRDAVLRALLRGAEDMFAAEPGGAAQSESVEAEAIGRGRAVEQPTAVGTAARPGWTS